jgi:phosphocarrier protein
MIKERFTVLSKEGLHARPASFLTKIASKYEDTVEIHYLDKKVTLKSIMMLMSLGIPYEAEFEIVIEGDNEDVILEELKTVLKDNQII